MGRHETFDHTADVGLRVQGADLDDLFRTAAEGLIGYVVVNPEEVRPAAAEPVDLREDGPAELLATWLGELIFRVETRHTLYCRFDVRVEDDGRRLVGTIAGEPIDRDRHILDHEVKAVTRHGLRLDRLLNGWVAEVILDI